MKCLTWVSCAMNPNRFRTYFHAIWLAHNYCNNIRLAKGVCHASYYIFQDRWYKTPEWYDSFKFQHFTTLWKPLKKWEGRWIRWLNYPMIYTIHVFDKCKHYVYRKFQILKSEFLKIDLVTSMINVKWNFLMLIFCWKYISFQPIHFNILSVFYHSYKVIYTVI